MLYILNTKEALHHSKSRTTFHDLNSKLLLDSRKNNPGDESLVPTLTLVIILYYAIIIYEVSKPK